MGWVGLGQVRSGLVQIFQLAMGWVGSDCFASQINILYYCEGLHNWIAYLKFNCLLPQAIQHFTRLVTLIWDKHRYKFSLDWTGSRFFKWPWVGLGHSGPMDNCDINTIESFNGFITRCNGDPYIHAVWRVGQRALLIFYIQPALHESCEIRHASECLSLICSRDNGYPMVAVITYSCKPKLYRRFRYNIRPDLYQQGHVHG